MHAVGPATSAPLATATSPSSTDTEMANAALSVGTSLAGNHVRAPSGSLSTNEPSLAPDQPMAAPSMASLRTASGSPS